MEASPSADVAGLIAECRQQIAEFERAAACAGQAYAGLQGRLQNLNSTLRARVPIARADELRAAMDRLQPLLRGSLRAHGLEPLLTRHVPAATVPMFPLGNQLLDGIESEARKLLGGSR